VVEINVLEKISKNFTLEVSYQRMNCSKSQKAAAIAAFSRNYTFNIAESRRPP
jgi:hypothetical protein